MQIYSFNLETKEIDLTSLRPCDYLDAVTPSIPANAIIADKPLEPKENTAYIVAYSPDNNGQFKISRNVQTIHDYRGQTVYSTIDQSEIIVTELGIHPKNTTTIKPNSPCQRWDEVSKNWVMDKAKQQQQKSLEQAQMWENIKAKRHEVTHGGIYLTSVGKWFHTNESTRIQYLTMQQLPHLPEISWKTMDNSFVSMTKKLLDEIILTIISQEQADFSVAEQHKAKMEKADNPLTYDYSAGWSKVYE